MKNLEEILKGCINHEKKAQQTLFYNFKSLYKSIALRYLQDTELAKEVVQLSFIKIFNNIDDLKKVSAFESWSRRIVINTALNESKKRKIRNDLFVVSNDDEYVQYDNVELELIRKIDNEQLIELINTMPEGYRTVFNLYMIDGYSHEEISKMLGIEKSTSRSQLTKAKKKLNELVSHLTKDEEGRAYGK